MGSPFFGYHGAENAAIAECHRQNRVFSSGKGIMARPRFSSRLSEEEFLSHYWLKTELAQCCRKLQLPSTGSKEQLTQRIANRLAGRQVPRVPSRKKKQEPLADELTLQTRIGRGWTCSNRLRQFFQLHCGRGFRFNGPLREFLASGSGGTLGQAIEVYRASLQQGPRSIGSQFQYNRHMREYKSTHPGCSHAQAVEAWWQRRGGR